MENASKALIMAGSMLLAMLIVSLLIMGWNRISDYNKKEEESETLEQIAEFNKEFESYNKKIVYGYEIVSLNNLINDTNTRYSEEDGYEKIVGYIELINDTTLTNQLSNGEKNTWTRGEGTFTDFFSKIYNKDLEKIFKESYFQCTEVVYNGDKSTDIGKGSGKIQEMHFEQIRKKE